MKSKSNIAFIVVIVALIVLQIGYMLTIYKDEQQVISANKGEIKLMEKRIQQLEERVKMLPETEKELALVTAQKVAMLNTIPDFEAASKEGAELIRYMKRKDFANIGFEAVTEEATASANADADVLKRIYELTFVGRYKDVIDFVDSLNKSYQIINSNSFEMNNELQSENSEITAYYKAHYGEDFDQLVTSKLKITIYTRPSEQQTDEIYQPNLDSRRVEGSSFRRFVKQEEEVSPSVSQNEEQPNQESPITTYSQYFNIYIGDILSSGDTYGIDGPGGINGSGYVGLISQTDTSISLVIREDGYEITAEDNDGNVKQTFVDTPINNACLKINSTMRNVLEIMPNVHIYVYNYTKQIMDVELTGSLLGNIHIFNEFDQQVSKGQTKGNIRVK